MFLMLDVHHTAWPRASQHGVWVRVPTVAKKPNQLAAPLGKTKRIHGHAQPY
jgi:hypothetical protein